MKPLEMKPLEMNLGYGSSTAGIATSAHLSGYGGAMIIGASMSGMILLTSSGEKVLKHVLFDLHNSALIRPLEELLV